MALVKCRECKKQISNTAVACPHCGAPGFATASTPQPPTIRPPAKSGSGCLTLLVVVGVLFGLGMISMKFAEWQRDRATSARQAQERVAEAERQKALAARFAAERSELFGKVEAAWAEKKPREVLALLEPYKAILDPTLQLRWNAAFEALEPERKAAEEAQRKAQELAQQRQAAADAERRAVVARIGEAPKRFDWDGDYFEVERYLQRVANDPDSIEVSDCTHPSASDKGWVVSCQYRGRNAFNALITKRGRFVIRHGQVVEGPE